MLKLFVALPVLQNVALAITETLTTPGLDLTHGKAGTAASALTFVVSTL